MFHWYEVGVRAIVVDNLVLHQRRQGSGSACSELLKWCKLRDGLIGLRQWTNLTPEGDKDAEGDAAKEEDATTNAEEKEEFRLLAEGL